MHSAKAAEIEKDRREKEDAKRKAQQAKELEKNRLGEEAAIEWVLPPTSPRRDVNFLRMTRFGLKVLCDAGREDRAGLLRSQCMEQSACKLYTCDCLFAVHV